MKPRQAHRILFSMLMTLVLAVLVVPSLSMRAYAEGEILQAASFLDFANATEADVDNASYLVDKDTGTVNDEESFAEVFGEEFPEDDVEACMAIEESGDYLVSNEDNDTFYVSSTFGCKRLDVMATLTSLYGAEKGVTYEGETLLQFATEEATEAAYNQLVELFGEDKVMADSVVWAMDAHGWGTAAMGLDVQTSSLTNYISAGTVSGDKVVVAVVDSGINPDHEIFSNCTISSLSSVIGQAGSSYIDDDGHGTMTAGIIAESCPANIEIMAVKVLNNKGTGSTVDCLNGIRYATENGADVINCSWASKGSEDSATHQTYMANMDACCKEAYDQGILICAAAGNDGQDMDEESYTYTKNGEEKTINKPDWLPSECQYVMCVGSVDSTNVASTGKKSSFSNYGDALDFTAPGRSISLADYTNNTGYENHNGTSFSSPYVAAACALLKEYDRSIGFEDAVQALASISRDFGDEGWDRTFGYGMPVFTEYEPLGHKWDTSNIGWEWTGNDTDGYSAATATLPCLYDSTHTNVREATLTSEKDGDETVYTATASFDGVSYSDTKTITDPPTPAASDSVYLAFGSDRHTVTTAIGTAMAGIPKGIVSYVALAGDSASDTTDKTSDVLNELIGALGDQINATNVQEIYGNHDEAMIRDTDPDIIKVDSSGSSDVVYTGLDSNGDVLYYVWGIAYDDMAAKHNEQGINYNYDAEVSAARAQAFKNWVDTVDSTIPIIVVSHVPLHALRGDNYSGAVWNEALNYAATGRANISAADTNCEIIRNVVFLHGHNHTSENTLRTYLPYNADDASTSGSRAIPFQSGSSTTVTTPVYYAYMTAGYLSKYAGQVNGHSSGAYNNKDQHSTLMEITDDQLTFYLFPAASLESATVRQTVNRVEPVELGELEFISVDASGAKTMYYVGETIDLSGLVVTASYSSGRSRVISNYTTDAATSVDLTAVGTYTVTVTHREGDVTKEATFEVTVTEAPALTTMDVYELASSLQAGGEYLIVSADTVGSAYALTHSSGAVDRDAVTILPKSNLTSNVYVVTDDVDEGSIWKATSEGDNLKLKNGDHYLQIARSSNSFTISAPTSQSYSSGAWTYNSSSHALGYQYSSNSTRYIRYANSNFTTTSSSSYAVYLYKKTTITVPLYTITFVDDDGSVLKEATQYAEGTKGADIVQPETPTKSDSATHTYVFAGWEPEIADVTDSATYTATYTATPLPDGWVDLSEGVKGYRRGGELVTGWFSLESAKYYFQPDGSMSVGWTDVDVDGKTMHYYFNPASGNLVRDTWFQIDGKTYYFRPSGNLATGWATINDNGVDKKYYLDEDGQLVTGWQDVEVDGKVLHYYFRPSGAMATGWATIDGEKYWFRPSGNMATGWADVDDAYKRYFDEEGHMLTGWQEIDGKQYYFRDSGAMQTGTTTIGGVEYTFSDKGVLVS